MSFNFLDMVMEAKGNKPIKINTEAETDYTQDELDNGETEAEADDTEDEVADETEDDEATDYTEDEQEDTEAEDPDQGTEDDLMGDDEEPTDYTDTDEDLNSDDSDGYDNTGSEESNEPSEDDTKNKALLEDLIHLKELIKNFINKTSSIKGTDITKVKITNEINNNLDMLSKQIHNYIVYRFSKETYVRNLYFYNYSVEALNISINMIKKINGFKDNK